MSYDQKLIDFCNYVQPIINGCTGFIKTDGYIVHNPGILLFMNADETCFGMINIPVIFDIYLTSVINTFLSLKTPEEQSNLYNLTYFVGYNIKKDHLLYYYNLFSNIDSRCSRIFYEPDCFNISGFDIALSSSDIGYVNVSDGQMNYRIPASKSITPLTKSDSAGLSIYNNIYGTVNNKTFKYTVTKKKFKITIDIFSNIIIV